MQLELDTARYYCAIYLGHIFLLHIAAVCLEHIFLGWDSNSCLARHLPRKFRLVGHNFLGKCVPRTDFPATPESRPATQDGDDTKVQTKGNRKITDVFTWIQRFATYASVRRNETPEAIPELMAYMMSIIRVSRKY